MNKSYRNQKNVLYKIPGSSVNDSYNEQLSYDKNGNILTLKRNGEDETEFYTFMIDDLDYDYDGNQLRNVTDTSGALQGFNDGNKHTQTKKNDFEYDDYGNMVIDRNKGITNITYNHLNLPKKITFENNRSIEYIYGADGSKLRKKLTDGTKNKTVDYLNGFQYRNNLLDFFPTAEGYVRGIPTDIGGGTSTYSFHYIYNYTDHLGNIRLKYTAHPQTSETQPLEENHYYPFGLTHDGYQPHHRIIGLEGPGANVTIIPTSPNVGDPYKYKFGGKEYQDEFDINFYDFGARNYDAALGRWMNVDPLAEAMPSWSSYAYTFNNPVRFTDPTGMIPESPNTDIFKVFKNEDGTYRAEKWKHINDGKNDQMNLVMNDDGVATSMYQGVEAQHDMYKDGIKLDGVDYKNGSTLDIVVKATSDFLTSDDYRTKNARETMKNYVTAAGLVITGP